MAKNLGVGKVLTLDKAKKNEFSFGFVLAKSYL